MDGNLKWRIVDRSGDREPLDRRRYAAAAGVLCAGASVCTLASSILLEATAALTAIALAAFGLLLAFGCFVIPWERVGTYLVRLAPAVATVAVAISATTIDPTYGFYLVLVAGFVAYSFRDQRAIGLHLGLIACALLAPVVIGPEGTRTAVACALIFGPGVVLVTVIAAYVRRSSEARERAYREFANDAMALAARIRSRVGTGPAAPLGGPEWIEQPSPAIPLRKVGIAKVVRVAPAGGDGEPAAATPLRQGLPMTAVALAASVIAVVSTTAAFLSARDDQVAAGGGAPVLTRDAKPDTVNVASPGEARRASRRRDRERPLALTDGQASSPAVAAAVPSAEPADGSAGAGGNSQPALPAPTSPSETTVPARPQPADPNAGPPPTPVQQGAAAGPVGSAMGLVDETVDPVVGELQK